MNPIGVTEPQARINTNKDQSPTSKKQEVNPIILSYDPEEDEEDEESKEAEKLMQSYNLMGLSSRPRTDSIMKNIRDSTIGDDFSRQKSNSLKSPDRDEAVKQQPSSNEYEDDSEEENSIFANSPIGNCSITGKKKGSRGSGSDNS